MLRSALLLASLGGLAGTAQAATAVALPTQALALAARSTDGILKKMTIERRAPQKGDIDIEVHYCGICHSDLHQVRGEWPIDNCFPMVPGHEVVGLVRSVGSGVRKFKVGDRVGVGCFVDSCRDCAPCKNGEEQYCHDGMASTYNCATDWYGRSGPKTALLEGHEKELTFGGYSQSIVVDESYVLKIPDGMDLAKSAPLLCAGITTYSPLNYWGALKKGKKCVTGVVGFGGLGHMAVKIAKAAGNEVHVFSTSESKREAIEALGAKFILSKDKNQMKSNENQFDIIIDTVSANHPLPPLLDCLKKGVGATLCLVGLPPDDVKAHAFDFVGGRKQITGSLIGGIKETQEMLNFCAKHKIIPDVELIHPKEVNHAMNMLSKNSAPTSRFVIDIKDGLKEGDWEVEDDEGINPQDWHVHERSDVLPASARHAAHQA